MATMGRSYCGYSVLAVKRTQLLAADSKLKVLLAHIHAFFDSLKVPIELVEFSDECYWHAIIAMLQAVRLRLRSSYLCWKVCIRRPLST